MRCCALDRYIEMMHRSILNVHVGWYKRNELSNIYAEPSMFVLYTVSRLYYVSYREEKSLCDDKSFVNALGVLIRY